MFLTLRLFVSGMPPEEALADLKKRISNYENAYQQVTNNQVSYIKLFDLRYELCHPKETCIHLKVTCIHPKVTCIPARIPVSQRIMTPKTDVCVSRKKDMCTPKRDIYAPKRDMHTPKRDIYNKSYQQVMNNDFFFSYAQKRHIQQVIPASHEQ